MDLPLTLYLLIVAIVAGIFGSLLGLGGGVIIIPVYTLLLNAPIHTAIGASIIGVIAVSSAGATFYLREEVTNVRLSMVLEVAATLGAIIGALAFTIMNPRTLTILYGLVLVYSSLLMLRRVKIVSEERALEGGHDDRLPLSGEYFDKALNAPVRYIVRSVKKGMVATLFAGSLTGLLGVGGGLINVPVMRRIMRVPIKVATATSNFMMGVTGIAGAFIYYTRGFVDPLIAVPTAIGVLIGAQIGPRLAHRISGVTLERAFALVLIYMAAQMLLKGMEVPLPF